MYYKTHILYLSDYDEDICLKIKEYMSIVELWKSRDVYLYLRLMYAF